MPDEAHAKIGEIMLILYYFNIVLASFRPSQYLEYRSY